MYIFSTRALVARMSVVNITNIQVLNNPARFTDPFQFEITFECISPLEQDLEWKIVYVGSAEDEKYDQVLDCIMVGPVPVGINKFVFQADAPRIDFIPPEDLLGVTVVLIVCLYNGQEFVRVGYYVNNEYDQEELRLEPPAGPPIIERVLRQILADKPRVTRFPIRWDGTAADDEMISPLPPPPSEAERLEDEAAAAERGDGFIIVNGDDQHADEDDEDDEEDEDEETEESENDAEEDIVESEDGAEMMEIDENSPNDKIGCLIPANSNAKANSSSTISPMKSFTGMSIQ